MTTILDVIDVILEEHLAHFEESRPSQEGITARLMLGSYSHQV